LGHQLDELVKNGFLKDYLVESQGGQNLTALGEDQGHEIPVHGEIHTIVGGFLGGWCTASQWKKYARAVMTVEAQEADEALDVDLVFTRANLRDVVPHDNDPVVISIVTAQGAARGAQVDLQPLAFLYMGNRYPGFFPFGDKAYEVPRGHHRVLHEVDRG